MKTDAYKGIVRLKDGKKEKYQINKAVGDIQDAHKYLLAEVPNAVAAVILVPPAEHFVEPQVA